MRVHAVARPAQELLGEKAERHHRELQVEPVVLEPEEQLDAENDRERAEAEHEGAPVRPREQAVEAVGKQELRGNERRGVIDLAPVVAPIQDDRALQTGLQVVLAAQHDFERHLLPTAQNAEQQPAPREQEQRGGDDGGAHRGTLLQRGELAEHEQAGDEAGVEDKGATGRESGAGSWCSGRGAQGRSGCSRPLHRRLKLTVNNRSDSQSM